MHLDKLELNGFKSFADKTTLKILPGITAIVGPNGCGKTNIVDAITWVLGSQSPRQLRGSKMEDVIFNGSASRPPVGMAEIALTFDNSDGRFPIEYSEVAFSRRIFRSGESEYLINGKSCRLKDIQNLLLGTGLGNRSYSVIEQGRIEWIVLARPEERRALLEEAAGISKFRAHKEEALRKLENVSNNLLRVEDIVREVRRQLRLAEKQAAQARQYRDLRDRFRELEIAVAVSDLAEMRKDEERLEREIKVWEAKLAEKQAEADSIEDELVRLREDLRNKEHFFEQRRARALGAEAELATSRRQVELNQGRLSEIGALGEEMSAEIAALESSRSAADQEVERLRAELEILRDKNRRQEEKLRSAEERLTRSRKDLAEVEEGLNRLRMEMVESSRTEIRMRNEYSGLEVGEKEIVLRRRRLEVEMERFKDEEKEMLAGTISARDETEVLERRWEETRKRLEQKREELKGVEREVSSLRAEKEEMSMACGERRARLQLLQGWEDAWGGALESVKMIRREVEEGRLSGLNIIGLVADLLEVDVGQEKAAAAAWGENLWALIVRDWKDARRLVDSLRAQGAPGIRLIVAEALRRGEEAEEVRPAPAEYPFRLASPWTGLTPKLVAVPDWRSRSMEEEEEDAAALVSAGDCAFPSPGVVLWVGAGSPAEKIVSRKKSMKDLAGEIDSLSRRLEEAEKRLQAKDANRQSVADELKRIEQESREAELNLMLNRAESGRRLASLEKNRSQQKGLRHELAELERESEGISRRRLEVEGLLQQSSGREGKEGREFEDWERRKNEMEAAAAAAAMELTALKIDLASSREREDSLAARLEQVGKRREEAMSVLESRRRQLESSVSRRGELERENQRLQSRIEELEMELKGLSPRIESLSAEIAGLDSVLREKEKLHHSLRPALQEGQSELNSRRMLLAQERVRVEALFQRIREKYDIDLETLPPPSQPVERERIGTELEELKTSMDKMGMVNLAALESKETLEKRLSHLTGQRDDLVGARADLEAAIRKINITAREKLEATYQAVRENFQRIFQELFSGGKADLVLDQETDILEAGLDIKAQPPGKKLSHISLLSGGEKALASIALVFALFKVQPSPFYILDEIDAPLDESNIARFVRLLREFSRLSQFIIITHNKRTISEADILYGITMEESGVSKVVSVKLGQKS